MSTSRSPELLQRSSSRLLIVDMQEKLVRLTRNCEAVIANCVKLLRGAQLLGVPIDATEQYPKGLGPTTPELLPYLPAVEEKVRFSCAEALPWVEGEGAGAERFQVVLAGIESHVCIQQTAFDLLSAGLRVYLAADACTSRSETDRHYALQRMADAGVVLTTTESILFEWCETAAAPEFKQLSKLITGRE